MKKELLFLLSGILVLLSILIQLLRFIQIFDKDILNSLSGASLGVGIVFFIFALFRRKNK
jgi:hypothetical protein